MFRVECTSCKAAYQVDERRVPAKGLMMKCPKCRASFLVSPPEALVDLAKPANGPAGGEATAPLPDVQPKAPAVGTPSGGLDVKPAFGAPPAVKVGASQNDLPAAVTKVFELPNARGRSRNDETMIGVAPAVVQSRSVPLSASNPFADLELPEPKRSPDDARAELPAARRDANVKLTLDKPTTPTSAASGKAGTSPTTKGADKPSGPLAPQSVRKVSRINLPSLQPKAPATPKSEGPESPPSSSEPSLPEVLGAQLKGPATASLADDEFELPDVFGAKPKPAKPLSDAALIFSPSRQELPGVALTQVSDDLPAALGTSTASLPAVSVGRRAPIEADESLDFGGLPLDEEEDEDRATQSMGMVDLDSEGVALETVPPSNRPASNRSGGDDLPDLFGVDLPSIPASAPVGGESDTDDAGLGFGELDLPALDATITEGSGSPLSGMLPSFAPSDAPSANTSSAPPSFRARHDSFGDFEGLPTFGDATSASGQTLAAGAKSTLDSDEHDPFEEDGFSLGSAHEKPAVSARGEQMNAQARGAASTSREYGQVNLDDSIGSLAPEMDDEMEFGGIPQADSDAPAGVPLSQKAPSLSQEPKPAEAEAKPQAPPEPTKPKSRRALKWGAAVAVVLLGGAALSLEPRIGPFGAFVIGDLVSKGEHEALLRQMDETVTAARQSDQYAAVVAANTQLEQASNGAKRFTPLQIATATQHLATVLRFGGPSSAQSKAQVLLSELQSSGVEGSEYATARAISGILAQGAVTPEQTLQQLPNTLLAQAVRGEYWLLVGDAKQALDAWSKAVELNRSAWSLFGVARAEFMAGRLDAAAKQAALVLQTTPEHAGALLLSADVGLRAGKHEAIDTKHLDLVVGKKDVYSPREVALAHTLKGELEFAFGRVGKALDEFEAALAVQPNDTRALTASGNALLASGRHAAALARFQAAKTADPRALAPALGQVRANLALQQVDAAKQLIAALQRTHGRELEVKSVVGVVALATGEIEAAKKVLLEAANASKNTAGEVVSTPSFQRVAVETYVALATAYSRSGEPERAAPILQEALTQLPKSAALRTALGDLAVSAGQFDKALSEFREAQKLAPNELEPVFKAGSVLRRLKRFDEAAQAFEKVAQADPEYLGLPLERGLILEQSGNVAEALLQYETALKNAPGDLDVQLRVGCGRVAAGNAQGAREVLKGVMDKRPKSAEAAYCLGRALFADGNNLEALRWLRQAVDFDGNSAQYHLYLGWVASEAAQIALAQKELNRALTLDPGLADAYWQRGVLNLKQGAARDAMLDFKKTLELKPDRHDANADMAQALSQLGKEKDAVPYWERALAAEPNNMVWLFRYGKLLVGRQQMAKGTELLQRAIEQAGKAKSKPNWLWQAHYWAALGFGESAAAVKHWREYLTLSGVDSPYRDEAKRALKRAGQTWEGD